MKNKNSVKLSVILLMAVVLVCSIISCSSKNNSSADGDIYNENMKEYEDGSLQEYYQSVETGASYNEFSGAKSSYVAETNASPIQDTRKIIRTISLSLETKTFDNSVAKITQMANEFGGYLEYSNISGNNYDSNNNERYANFTIRIPAEKLDSYINSLGEGFNVLNKTENTSDITDMYYDATARLNSLKTQEERLISMLEGATELQYMLQLEQTLADVRYQIESYYSTIQRYDSQVALSTLTISLQEVIEYKPEIIKPKTFGERISIAFKQSWNNFTEGLKDYIIEFIYSIPVLIIWAIFITAAIIIIVKITKKRRNKKLTEKNDSENKKTDIK